MRLIANHERRGFFNRILLDAIDLHGRMISSRAKQMAFMQVMRVNIRAWIDDKRGAASGHFDAQCIVVTVRAAAV